jgi:hypothetical protein
MIDTALSGIKLSEDWRPATGYEGYYSVSSLGRVRRERVTTVGPNGRRNTSQCRLLHAGLDKNGHPRVTLSVRGKCQRIRVDYLVAKTFLGPRPEGTCIVHGEGGKLDCSVKNLSYGSRRLVMPRGDGHYNSKLSEDAVRIIRESDMSRADLAERFGVSVGNIAAIRARRSWAHVA